MEVIMNSIEMDGKGECKLYVCFLHLCPCCVMSMALLAGTGEPPSVTLNTSIDFLSGLLFPCLFSMGESTRFLGGSAHTHTLFLFFISC